MAKLYSVTQRVLELMFKETAAADSIHRRDAILAVLDEMRDRRTEDLGFNRHTTTFTPTAGDEDWSLSNASPISARVERVLKLYYIDSSSRWCPTNGLPPIDYSDLRQRNSEYSGNHSYAEAWAMGDEDSTLWITPPPDGVISFALVYLGMVKKFEYDYDGSDWSFTVNGTAQDDVESVSEDSSEKWFSEGGDVLTYGAVARLYQGAYNGDLQQVQRWRALSNDAAERAVRDKDRREGDWPIQGYI